MNHLAICVDRLRLLGILVAQLCITTHAHASLTNFLVDCSVLTVNGKPLTAKGNRAIPGFNLSLTFPDI